MNKYFNNAIVGNSNMLGCITDNGELIRLYYPDIDYFQNIDMYNYGVIVNSKVEWLSDARLIKQYYDTNILYTELENDYVHVIQKDYVLPNRNVLVRKLTFDKKINLFVYSRLNTNVNRLISGMIVKDTLIQYCQEFYMATFSDFNISNYQINNSQYTFNNTNLNNEDYIGMSPDAAITYSDVNEITLYISLEKTLNDVLNQVDLIKNKTELELYSETRKYWKDYIDKLDVDKLYSKENDKINKIIDRTAYMFALLSNKETGGVLASPDVDETFSKCGRYGYCWPRDAQFILKAFSILGLNDNVENFYTKWAVKAQLNNGLFEQRYYTNGDLAPSWGVQIDETSAMLTGINKYGKCRKLEDVIVKATDALINFLDENYLSKPCFDLWEERKDIHLYSTASIYAGLKSAKEMLSKISKIKYKDRINNIDRILPKILSAIRNNFVEKGIYKRGINDYKIDISLLSLLTPFELVDANDPIIKNTAQEIEKRIKLPNGGYLRYEDDAYIGGNAWIISSLWLAMYYIKMNEKEKANELFDWVTNHADNLCFLPEQIERNGDRTAWISQLSWSHAMYIIVRNKLKE